MRTLGNILLVGAGYLVVAFTVGGVRTFGNGVGAFDVVSFALVVALFTLPEDRILALAVGMGTALDMLGAYPFPTWTVIVLIVTLVGFRLSQSIITNRSLFALLTLGTVMHVLSFVTQLIVSRLTAWPVQGAVALRLDGATLIGTAKAFGFELIALYLFFLFYLRFRGRAAGTLTHLSPYGR